MSTTHKPLTISDVIDLTVIIRAAQGNAAVIRLIDDRRYEGVARSICTENGRRDGGADVRDLFLRVTLLGGVDAFWPVRDLMADVAEGTFVNRDA